MTAEKTKFSIQEFFSNIFYLDSRSLSLFRILIGILGCYRFSLALFWSNEFLSPQGFSPVSTSNLWATRWSLFYLNHTLLWSQLLCLLGLVLSVAFCLGYRVKTVGVILWVLTLSLSNRAMAIENSGCSIFRLMLMWSLFLPLTEHFSVSKKSLTKPSSLWLGASRVSSVAVLGIFSQFIIFYFFAGVTKYSADTTSDWSVTFDAVYKSLEIGPFARHLGVWLSDHYQITQALTVSTLVIEIIFPFFLLYEGKWLKLRSLSVATFLMLQLGFGTVFSLGIFPLASFVFATVFIPTSWWNLALRCYSRIRKVNIESSPLKKGESPTSLPKMVLVSLIMFFSWWDALGKYPSGALVPLPSAVEELVFLPRIDQRWWMFVIPSWDRYWFDVKGVTASGKLVDPWAWYRGDDSIEYSLDEPGFIKGTYSSQPWNRYLHETRGKLEVAQWFLYNLCVSYNKAHPSDRILKTSLMYSSKKILGFKEFGPINVSTVSTWECPK